jgi:spermidine synthase
LTTREFLHAVRRALKPEGLAVANIWSRLSNPLYDAMVNTYEDVFDRLYLLDVPGAGNIILFASPRRQQIKRDGLVRRARELTQEWQVSFELDSMVRRGFGSTGSRSATGRILEDKPEDLPAEVASPAEASSSRE